MWCHIIMFSFSLVSVFLAWTLDYTFQQPLTSFLCSPGVLSVFLAWSSMSGVPILALLIPLLLELSAGRCLPLLGVSKNFFSHIISIAFILVQRSGIPRPPFSLISAV